MPYFDDDGNEIFPNLIPTPPLCMSCKKDNPNDEVLCNLTKLEQSTDKKFVCFAYESIGD